jgi:hypothetical protein
MVKKRTLGKASGPGRVLDLRRAVGSHRREARRRGSAGEEILEALERDHLTQLGQPVPDLADQPRHRVAAETVDVEEAYRPRLAQHVVELARLIGGIDGDDHQPREAGTELEDQPFGEIGRPERDPFARREAREQGARGALRIGEQRPVGPGPALAVGESPGDHRDAIGSRVGRGAQHRTDRGLLDPVRGVGRPERSIEWHRSPSPSARPRNGSGARLAGVALGVRFASWLRGGARLSQPPWAACGRRGPVGWRTGPSPPVRPAGRAR